MRTFAYILGAVLLFGCGDKDSAPQDAATADNDGAIDTPGAGDDGGTGDAGTDAANATCEGCAQTMCSTAYAACQGDTVCKCTYDCVIGGGAEGQCKNQCSTGNNTGWSDMISCMDSMCGNSC